MAGIKIYPADEWVSKCIREANNNQCEICGGTSVQCCHYETRGNWATRFDPINLFCFCYGHHIRMDGSPIQFHQYYIDTRGQYTYDLLVEKSNDLILGKRNRQEKKEIAKYFKKQYEEIILKRSQGNIKKIEVIGY